MKSSLSNKLFYDAIKSKIQFEINRNYYKMCYQKIYDNFWPLSDYIKHKELDLEYMY